MSWSFKTQIKTFLTLSILARSAYLFSLVSEKENHRPQKQLYAVHKKTPLAKSITSKCVKHIKYQKIYIRRVRKYFFFFTHFRIFYLFSQKFLFLDCLQRHCCCPILFFVTAQLFHSFSFTVGYEFGHIE